MEVKKHKMRQEERRALEAELRELKGVKRTEIAQAIKEATAQGDLSENAEYHAAREEQGHIEGRILEIEELLKNVEIISDDEITTDKVNIGTIATIRYLDNGREVSYKIVGSTQVNVLKKEISNESPIGSALMGQPVGEEVEIVTPAGIRKARILQIEKA